MQEKETSKTPDTSLIPEKFLNLFERVIASGKETLKSCLKMPPLIFAALCDKDGNITNIGIAPILPRTSQTPEAIFKGASILAAEGEKVFGYITAVEAHMQTANKDKFLGPDGKIRADYIPPSKDPNAKDVLIFTLRTDSHKYVKIWEYIASSDGHVVISPKPVIDSLKVLANGESPIEKVISATTF